ncbi:MULTISPECIES: YbaL family putative K(+) efflux transporter [Bradyrhizobium]|jgi:K+:H+ antiporter|uniref:YbaL family putative K(+) efflux transporter n=1 Tax=Bradyrhizobium TaxID=374 RepID=UPI00048444A1|nr:MULTISPECIES: YbaL family putative K(+) efflux transporter [Bradyrhizobium]MCS3446935.1 CPA2 family monovalent cation:H+ antiporter-2 [Bradyrhizobium elkanii]MCS3561932.1 CPA2 family monovalent cation:H+ antiporter-2 [Bradyrhizobium elkanii]MCW2148230.1 CPA2 family monovalent cation:H+ antiporter-2 [Bradyrhizobium elkanii]MCW2352685.1 CPA2 family monovalent cation:H+ antiporter-2 [Bradyrhizobium elkanii]MCW2371956.1 CPA2 family monovalent cation:H+ antiporter-2 [Bradyrhizobium elkanii]
MPHDTPLIATVVAGLGLAFVFGTIAQRFRVPPLVGYLLAGVAVGPFTPGFVADQALATELAELGIILLMFGVGLHFSLNDLLSVRAIAVPGAIAQIAVATLMGLGLALLMGWTVGAGLVFGLALSVASTVVLLRALQERRLMDTERGKIAVGWLIVEDLAMVLALVLFPAVASLQGGDGAALTSDPLAARFGLGLTGVLLLTLIKIAVFIALMLVVGRRLIPWVLHYIAHTGSRELFRLTVLAIALCIAFGATKLFGVSLALGAFFAGMMLRESPLSQRAAQETLPLRDAFAVLFFVSVGMLFDPFSLVREPWPFAATLFVIVVGKSLAALLIVVLFRHPMATALMISASLAQIGEFSFILAELGVALNLLPKAGRDLILAGAIVSIMLNPLVFAVVDWLTSRLEKPQTSSPTAAASEPFPVTELQDHTILVGYGRVGSIVGDALHQRSAPFLAVEASDDMVAKLKERGIEALMGNAARASVLRATNPAAARSLVIAIPEAFEAGQIVEQARAANADIQIIARAHSDAEVDHLKALGADIVIMGEREIARGMIEELDKARPGTVRAAEQDSAA